MIGDKLSDGIAAQSAGVGTIYVVSEAKSNYDSFIFIKSLEELLDAFKRLVRLNSE
jgi:phosphoglycolate phosphatase-like HAD superfamily hydrolase